MIYLAVLETMWDWRSRTSGAGFEKAPNFFCISPQNFSGRRLFALTGTDRRRGYLWCTNVCGELVTGPEQHGTPDAERLDRNLKRWDMLVQKEWVDPENPKRSCTILVCGKVAQSCYANLTKTPPYRTLYIPHPAARNWTKPAEELAARFIQEGQANLLLTLKQGRLRARCLCS